MWIGGMLVFIVKGIRQVLSHENGLFSGLDAGIGLAMILCSPLWPLVIYRDLKARADARSRSTQDQDDD